MAMNQDVVLSRTSGTPLHRQLFAVLRDGILSGVYQPGSALPKEEALCERFGVSRITVRRTLEDLKAEGLIEKRQGRGTFVSPDLPPARELPTLGFMETLWAVADDTRVEVLELETQPCSTRVARQLDLEEGAPVMRVLRLRRRGPTPVMLTEAFVPEALAEGIDEKALKDRALFDLLMDQGIEFGEVIQETTALLASPEQARLLEIDIGQPLIKLIRIMHDAERRPVELLSVLISPERSRVLNRFVVGSEQEDRLTSHIFHDAVDRA